MGGKARPENLRRMGRAGSWNRPQKTKSSPKQGKKMQKKVRCYFAQTTDKITVKEKTEKNIWRKIKEVNSIHLFDVVFARGYIEGHESKKPIDFYSKIIQLDNGSFSIKSTGEKIKQSNSCSILNNMILSS
jgi:hypothetical protein